MRFRVGKNRTELMLTYGKTLEDVSDSIMSVINFPELLHSEYETDVFIEPMLSPIIF